MLSALLHINSTDIQKAAADIKGGAANYHLWHLLAWQEIKQRYRRSTLGHLWLAVSMIVSLTTMGVLVTYLFNHSFERFIPYLCASLVFWQFMQGILNEGSTCLIQAQTWIMQIERPLFTYVMQMLWRNVIALGHNALVFVAVSILFTQVPNANILWAFVAFPLALLAIGWMGLLVAILSARFRDIPVMLQNAVAVLFWVTPIVYFPDQLGDRRFIVDLNPFSHILILFRAPFLGEAPSPDNWLWVGTIAVLGWAGTLLVFARFRSRVPYWL